MQYKAPSTQHIHVYSPAQLVFEQDMFMPGSANVAWDAIKQRMQRAICKSNEHKNSLQINHTYSAGDWMILIKKPGIICKLSIPYLGQYKVMRHNENGTITYETEPFVQ